MKNNLTAVIVAAGSGLRFKNKIPKPYLLLSGKPLLWYSLYSFQRSENVKKIFVVISEKDIMLAEKIKKKFFKNISKLENFIIGGNERQNSVFNALKVISKINSTDFAAIHDAARPFIRTALIDEVFYNAVKYGGSAPAVPIIDTVKIIDKENFITGHPLRENLYAIQTPQIFDFKKLYSAYNKSINNKRAFTDDAEVYGKYFKKIKLINGDNELFKITYPKDLDIAKKIIKKYKMLWK